MQILLHGPLTPAVAEALRRHGHQAHALGDVGLPPQSEPAEVLKLAQARQLDLLTSDERLATAPFSLDYWFGRSIIYLNLPGGDVEQDDAVDRLFTRYKRLTPARLYTVTGSRVKIRQLPSRK